MLFHVDLPGRVSNIDLPNSKALLPVFEAITNSIQSIKESGLQDNNYIKVHIIRDKLQTLLIDEDKNENYPIFGFVVEDNGVGFDNDNFNSFCTSDSQYKIKMGGKGIGRFLALKAFNNIEIESVFKENEIFYSRNFSFNLNQKEINDNKKKSEQNTLLTKVSLLNYKNNYRKACPQSLEKISAKMLQHFLLYFFEPLCPSISIIDDANIILLNQQFNEYINENSSTEEIEIKSNIFKIMHLKYFSDRNYSHQIHYCAHLREVVQESINNLIPNLTKKIKEDNGSSFTYMCYIFGDYLDNNVNPERTNFVFNEEEEIEFSERIFKKELNDKIVPTIKNFLKSYLDVINDDKIKKIKNYVYNTAPQYRNLLKHKENELENFSPNLSDDKVDIELYKLQSKFELEIRESVDNLLTAEKDEKYEEKLNEYIQKVNDIGKSNLVKYIVHRRTILELLQDNLKYVSSEDANYHLEEAVHSIIFPLKSTSDDISYEQQNLWIIDERLSYHYFLSSDKTINKSKGKKNGLKRPDLVIYNKPFAFVGENENYNSIIIIEFKRPGRNDYNLKENPIDQVFNYVDVIRDGNAKDKDGRPIIITDNTPFYCYIICDNSDTLDIRAQRAGLFKTPDTFGYYGYNLNYNTYIEIIPYHKLLSDAKKRNKILFDKLNIPIK